MGITMLVTTITTKAMPFEVDHIGHGRRFKIGTTRDGGK
jgi:hypothetical protein